MSTTTGEMRKYKVTDPQGNVYSLDPVDSEARQQIDDAELLQFDEDYFTADEDTTNKEVNIGLNGVPLGVDDTLKFVQDSQEGIVLGINSDVEDSGKILTVNSSGKAVWDNAPQELPPSSASDENKVLRVNDEGNPVWSQMETDIFGSITDDDGDEIQDEEGNAISDENLVELWTSFNGTGFGAERAVADADGNNIAETYAKKGETSGLTEASADEIDAMFQTTVTIGDRQYKTVIIGNQEWLAENLDYKFTGLEVGEPASDSSPRANYYNNDEATYGVNGNRYGLLYNWIAADYLETHKADLLPSGWHVPTTSEWTALFNECGGTSVAGTKLKSTSGWSYSGDGDGSTEFNAVPSGYQSNNNFSLVGEKGHYASNEVYGSVVYYQIFQTDATIGTSNASKANGLAIRLVRTIA